MRNSSLVKWICADNGRDCKHAAEATDVTLLREGSMVGERSLGVEAGSEEHRWSAGKRGCRNEYAINRVRISVTESLRVPEPGLSAPG